MHPLFYDQIPPAIINGICGIGCLSFTIALFYYFYCNTKFNETSGNDIRNNTKYYTIGSSIGFTIFCFAQLISSAVYSYQILVGLATLFWLIAQILTYLIYINRLYYTFDSTSYHITNSILYPLYILLTLFALCHVALGIVFFIEITGNLNQETAGRPYAICYILIELFDLIICIVIVYIFASKIMKLITDFDDEIQYQRSLSIESIISTSSPSMSPMSINTQMSMNPISCNLNHVQKLMIKVMTRYFVLTTIAIITTQIFMITRVLSEILFAVQYDGLQIWTVSLICQGIHCLISVITIFLIFSFGDNLYKISCKRLDIYCKMWCKIIAKRNVVKQKSVPIHNGYIQMTDVKL